MLVDFLSLDFDPGRDVPALQPDIFLSEIIGRPAWKVVDAELFKPEGFRNGDLQSGFAYGQADSQDVASAFRLQEFGFRLIDTNVQLSCPIDRVPIEPKTQSTLADEQYFIRFAKASDETQVGNIAENSFQLTRFHLDPQVPNKIANQIKRRWAENFFTGERGDKMVVAEYQEQIVGFLQLLERGAELIIDLIAVAMPHQGKKLARRMVQFATEKGTGYQRCRVGTQIANTRSLRAYQSLGFRISSSAYVFHFHGELPKPDVSY